MKIAVIGAGAMGGALAQGLLKGKTFSNNDITIADPSHKALKKFSDSGATTTTDNIAAIQDADYIAIVVKPWLVKQVIDDIKNSIDYAHQTLIIIAAGITGEDIKSWMKQEKGYLPKIFIAIPNIAIAYMASMTFVVTVNASLTSQQQVVNIFNEMGSCIITEERLLAAGTTLASCGIAYAMRYIRAASEGGVELGFKSAEATAIVLQTIKGAVSVLQGTQLHPEAAIDLVTTPGGVTIKGLNAMEHAGFTSAVIKGLKAGLK